MPTNTHLLFSPEVFDQCRKPEHVQQAISHVMYMNNMEPRAPHYGNARRFVLLKLCEMNHTALVVVYLLGNGLIGDV